jgi:hypothetical protein
LDNVYLSIYGGPSLLIGFWAGPEISGFYERIASANHLMEIGVKPADEENDNDEGGNRRSCCSIRRIGPANGTAACPKFGS